MYWDNKQFYMQNSDNQMPVLNIYSSLTPEMETFEKLSKFKYEHFQFRWSCLVFLANLYNFFAVGYFFGTLSNPEGIWLGLEVISECITFIDFLLRAFLTRTAQTNQMWFMHELLELKVWACLAISSFPFTTVFTLAQILNSTTLIGLRFFKIFRISQFVKFLRNLKMIFKESYLNAFEVFQGILSIILVSHYSGMLWMLNLRVNDKEEEKDNFTLFVDSILWAQETLTGIVQSQRSTTDNEKILTIIVMALGSLLYGLIFLNVFDYLTKYHETRSSFQRQKKILANWCESRKISVAMQERIFSYFQMLKEIPSPDISNILKSSIPAEMPLSLLSEIALFKFRDLISSVKLFELGEPSFVMSMVRSFTQDVYLQGDFVIRYADLPGQMHFISKGIVEVLATDGRTRIALLEDGEYFGEIGILFNCCRTVSVRAVSPCVLASITKENLMNILQNFKEHKDFLVKVAEQRMKTCRKEDINQEFDLVEDKYSSSDSDHSGELECPSYYAPAEHFMKSWWLRLITVPNSKTQKGAAQFEPLSYFYYFWFCVMLTCYSLYIFIIPYSISFGPSHEFVAIDGVCYVAFIADVYINYYTALLGNFKVYVHDRNEIHKNYMNHFFVLDALATIPADWVYCSFQCSHILNYSLKCLRFFKLPRVLSLTKSVKDNTEISERLIKIFAFFYIFCSLGHIMACVLDKLETSESNDYIKSLYWTFSIFSMSSFGDVGADTLSSKIVSIILMVGSKVFFVFIFAECVIFIREKNEITLDFVKKMKKVEEWMEFCKIDQNVRQKVRKFFMMKWTSLKGIEDEFVLKMLPESLSTDLRLSIFSGLIESGFFPTEEIGAILGIVRKCKLKMVSSGLEIVSRGELGFEMFFILEGRVNIHTDDNLLLKQLGPGSIFGELAILQDHPGVRMATVTAISDVTLACLSVEDYKEVSKSYSEFGEKVKKCSMDKNIENIGESIHLNSQVNEEEPLDNINGQNGKLFEKLEDNPLEHTQITNSIHDTKFSSHRINFRPLIIRIFQNRIKDWIYFIVLLWNMIFIPLKVSFDIRFTSLLMLIEILVIIFYILIALYNIVLASSKTVQVLSVSKRSLMVLCIFHLIIAAPVSLIIDLIKFEGPSSIIILFSFLRLLNFPYIFIFFHRLKHQKIFWYAWIQIIEILLVTFILSHFVGCLFIIIGNNNSHSWISDIEDDNYKIYISSFYWAFGTLIHMVQGDILSNTRNEKLFTCFIQIISVFFFGILFGGIIEVNSLIGSKLIGKFYSDYMYTIKFIQQKQITKYKSGINDYFNFIWNSQRGIFNGLVTEGLPESLKAEVFLSQYKETIKNSALFNLSQNFDRPLFQTMCRLMKFRYSMIGDVIMRIDDISNSMYFVLEGEVTIISINGENVVGVLGPGSHFGEVTALFNTPIKTATVVATKFTLSFVILEDDLEILLNAYPDWKEEMINFSQSRLVRTFGAKSLDEVSQICESISHSISTNYQLNRKYTKQSDILISHQIADAKALIFKDKRLTINLLHLILIIYSCILLPIEISFIDSYPSWVLALEIICFVESCAYLFIRMQNELKLKLSEIWTYKNVLLFDLLAISPFNFILPLAGISEPNGLISFIKSVRLFSVFRIHSLISSLMVIHKRLFLMGTIVETSLYLIIFLNWVACILHFNYSCSDSSDYLSSFYFSMNIITFTGHTDSYPCNTNLMIQVCIVGFISASVFSLFLGLLSSLASKSQPSIRKLFIQCRDQFKPILDLNPDKNLIYRLECFCKFSSSLKFIYGETIPEEIYSCLPRNIVDDLVYEKYRHMLKKVPVFKESESDVLLKRIALKLKAEIYLPADYLIYKDDIGEEMYFIEIGSVNIISPDNSKVIKSLNKGDFFGEMALINNSRRMCSVIANTLCLVYSLKKKHFYEILQNFPEVLVRLRKQSDMRSRETTSVTHSMNLAKDEDEEQNKLFNHLNMYSFMSSAYSAFTKGRDSGSLLTGMKNIKSSTTIDSFAKDRSQYKMYKRRPNINKSGERRNSQVALGRSLVFNRFYKMKINMVSKEDE